MKRLILIDGNAILHRAFHALPPLTTSKGELVNAVFGFTSMLLKIFEQFHPEYVAVCFDRKAPTFRKEKFKGYQAKRPAMVNELVGQIERVKEVVKTLNIPIFEKDGFEADDLIGTLAEQVNREAKTCETIIVTGDRDLLQLVNKKTKVYMPVKGLSQATLFDETQVEEKMGVKPGQMPNFKALIGDQSDNYPGVLGIGPKTAIDLIKVYGTLEKIYQNLDKIPPKIAEKLRKEKENAVLSLYLATIIKNAPVKLELEKCRLTDYDWDKVAKLFEDLEFRSLIARLPLDVHEFEKPSTQKAQKKTEGTEDKQMGLF